MAFKDKFIDFQSITVNDDIVLRQINVEKDIDEYFNMYNDTDAFKYYGGGSDKSSSQDTVKKILANQIKEFEKARIYSWTISEQKSKKALGRILLSDFEYNNKVANIGYFISRESWGNGIISACIKSVVDFGFTYLELERIYTTVHIENMGSWKALEKNGFLREGHLRHCFQTYSGLSDCYMYSILNTIVE